MVQKEAEYFPGGCHREITPRWGCKGLGKGCLQCGGNCLGGWERAHITEHDSAGVGLDARVRTVTWVQWKGAHVRVTLGWVQSGDCLKFPA